MVNFVGSNGVVLREGKSINENLSVEPGTIMYRYFFLLILIIKLGEYIE